VPDLLLIEDDHQGPIAGVPGFSLCQGRRHWAVIRSMAKSLGPDLRVAFVAGDAETVARVAGRQALGPGWVSYMLQALVIELLGSSEVRALLEHASGTYARRRRALLSELHARGVAATGRSGFNVWVEVDDEAGVVSRLMQRGWAVAAGARYRLRGRSAVRITCAALPEILAPRLAADVADALAPPRRSRAA
jgi:DNA-binding transcriptional MocR family regulator